MLSLTRAQMRDLIAAATSLLGLSYKFGYETSGQEVPGGIDCSELVEWCYRKISVVVPDGSWNQFQATRYVVGQPLTGDLIFTRKLGQINHVAMALDPEYLIEASGWHGQVIRRSIAEFKIFYRQRPEKPTLSVVDPLGFRRFKTEFIKPLRERIDNEKIPANAGAPDANGLRFSERPGRARIYRT